MNKINKLINNIYIIFINIIKICLPDNCCTVEEDVLSETLEKYTTDSYLCMQLFLEKFNLETGSQC
jgi:hypothetical protein